MAVTTKNARVGSATAALCEFVVERPAGSLPDDVVHATKRIIVDTIASAIAGLSTESGRVVARLKREQGGRPDATLFTGERVPCTSVAYVHSHLANILDADETLLNWGHFASVIVMPAIAVGEMTGATGAEVIEAVAIGFDIASRVGLTLPDYEILDDGRVELANGRGFSWAAFGTAAVAGRLLGLDAVQLAHAIGIVMATTPVHGALINVLPLRPLPWRKYAMYGTIAEVGVTAALLAKDGFVADAGALDEGSDYHVAFAAPFSDRRFLLDDLGTRWYITEDSIKPYPFCRFGHGALDLFGQIVDEQHIDADAIERVKLTAPPFAMMRILSEWQPPDDPMETWLCLPHAYWMIANRVPPGPRWFDPAEFRDPDRQHFAKKVSCEFVEAWNEPFMAQVLTDGKFRKVPITVEVTTSDGSWSRSTDYAKGDPWGEAEHQMTDAELATKVRDFTAAHLTGPAADRLFASAMQLDHAPDLNELTAAFTPAAS
jgi:2-methylcitrate dehydratase PrpD